MSSISPSPSRKNLSERSSSPKTEKEGVRPERKSGATENKILKDRFESGKTGIQSYTYEKQKSAKTAQNEWVDEQQSSFQKIKNRVDDQINQNRLENSIRLEENLEKSEDSFYQMRRMDAELEDIGRSYQLKVLIPEYERKGLKVQIVGQDLILSGMRSDSQKAVNEEGHEFSTHSYQNFSQKFKMDFPVDANGMKITEDDGYLVYTIPKYGPDHPVRENSRRPRINPKDFEMDRSLDFKNTLPIPSSVKKNV